MKLFGQESTYLYGRVLDRKFIAPSGSYPIEPLGMVAGMHPARYDGKVEIFYAAPIFNSYLVSREEDVNVLFSADGKVTVTNDDVARDVLYTFKVTKETSDLRVAEIYKFDVFYVGFKTSARVRWESSKEGRVVCSAETRYGTGPLMLQNNSVGDVASVVLYKKDKQLHFVQVGDPIKGVVEMTVVSAKTRGSYGVKNGHVRGFLISDNAHGVGDAVRCVVKEVCLGNYMFAEHVEPAIGAIIEAKVKRSGKRKVLLEHGGCKGYMLFSESICKRQRRYVKGIVYDIRDGVFLMSTKRMPVQGPEGGVDLSVPFDCCDQEDVPCASVPEGKMETSKTLAAERRRAKAVTEEDVLMDIKAHPGEAMPVIKYIQYKIEIGEEEAPRQIFDRFLPLVEGEEKDKLCISFVNYLMFVKDAECLRTIKRLSKMCSQKFLDVVASNTEDGEVLKLYFERTGTKRSFRMYLDSLFKACEKDAMRAAEAHKEFLAVSIDLMYKHCESPRPWVEKMLVDKKDVWMSYIRNESGAYLRGLYRRVVERRWKVADMKEFYKMWLEYEKENDGNVEEVKLRAREYVESIKGDSVHRQTQ